MAQYPARMDKLRAGAMRDITITTNEVSGTVSSDKPGILFLSIPYSTGWTAEVDGKPARVLRLIPGSRSRYRSRRTPGDHALLHPGLKAGLLLGGLGLLVLLGMLLWRPPGRASGQRFAQ